MTESIQLQKNDTPKFSFEAGSFFVTWIDYWLQVIVEVNKIKVYRLKENRSLLVPEVGKVSFHIADDYYYQTNYESCSKIRSGIQTDISQRAKITE